jgi:hypothetical protein
MKHIALRAAVCGLLLVAAPVGAQEPQRLDPVLIQRGGDQPTNVFVADSLDARSTRDRLQQILRQLPPAVGEVLRRDPSLLNRADYLDPYPALVAFLQQHPEIARNPSFFLGSFEYFERDPRDRAGEVFAVVLGGFAAAVAVAALLSVFVWLVRAIIEHRRWLRLSRVQAEVHTKVMDRLTSNDDLLAYIQTPAGRRFLESAPIAVEGAPRTHGAPVGSILWSLQGGVVLIALGIGMWFLQQQGDVVPEVSQALYVIGVIAAALGSGFVVSAVLAYVISSRMGLVNGPKVDHA